MKDADGRATGAVNTAGYDIHPPVLAARPYAVSASHTHTAFGTPWSANVEPFRAISQESCAFVFDQALFDDEEVDVLSFDGGKRIAMALGNNKLCILRNHGLLTAGRSVEESVGWFVMAERVAEVHVKAPNGRPISDGAAALPRRDSPLTPSDGGCSSGSSARRSPIARSSTEQHARLRQRPLVTEELIDLGKSDTIASY